MLTKTILNIMSNFIPNETVLVNERNPLWIKRKTKSAIQVKNLFYKKHLKPNNQETLKHFLKFRNEFGHLLGIPRRSTMKNSQTLSNYKFNGKCYWAILKRFFNSKKFLAYPFVTDFQILSMLNIFLF